MDGFLCDWGNDVGMEFADLPANDLVLAEGCRTQGALEEIKRWLISRGIWGFFILGHRRGDQAMSWIDDLAFIKVCPILSAP